MADAAAPDSLEVTVVLCLGPRETRESVVHLKAPATLRDALAACADPAVLALLGDHGASADGGLAAGIWGRSAAPDTVLAHLDRVEVYRPLKVDPKVARRQRFARQGARTTGLFARQRPGGKAGY
jgi:putative ubiquitin-RnfH superfamily antitoxin RatB of RatAB toxin-antitoxin module